MASAGRQLPFGGHPARDARCRGYRPPTPKIAPARGREGSRAVLPTCPLPRGKNQRGIVIWREIGTRNRERQRGTTWGPKGRRLASHRHILGRRQLCTSPSVPPFQPPAALRLRPPSSCRRIRIPVAPRRLPTRRVRSGRLCVSPAGSTCLRLPPAARFTRRRPRPR